MYVADSSYIDDRINGRSFPWVFLASDPLRFTPVDPLKEMRASKAGPYQRHTLRFKRHYSRYYCVSESISFHNEFTDRVSLLYSSLVSTVDSLTRFDSETSQFHSISRLSFSPIRTGDLCAR